MPVIPLVEVVGKVGKGVLTQIGAIGVNTGVIKGVIVTVNEVLLAHCPEVGVKVYEVVDVLLKAGDQVPVIPLVATEGSGFAVVPIHSGAIVLKVGVTFGVIAMVSVVVFAHSVPKGVKV